MNFAERLDGLIGAVSPEWGASRKRARLDMLAAQEATRLYEAAETNRRTSGWNRRPSGANTDNARGRAKLSWAARDLVQNSKYAAAGVRQLVATLWGDGIAPIIVHEDKAIRQRAQDEWDRWAEGKVDGIGDWYANGKLSVREMIVGGESLNLWKPDANGPDGHVFGIEGEQLDTSKSFMLQNGARIVQGVQYGSDLLPEGYWLFDENPHDRIARMSFNSRFVSAQDVDHMYERLRHGQARGASWLGAVAMTLKDIADIEDATRLREKVQACLAVFITPAEGQGSPLGTTSTQEDDGPGGLATETLRPGLIGRLRPGEQVSTLNPQPSAVTVDFIRQQLAAVSANMIPYHLMTGDVSQANYSGLRAAMNGSYAMIDDWQQNEIIPMLVMPAVRRRMQRLYLETGDRRFLDVKLDYARPIRRLVDPIKDLAGEVMEIRAGLKTLEQGLGERGQNAEEHLQRIKQMNDMIDTLGLALDSDPRRVTDSGVLQAAAGYLRPQGDN